MDRFSWIVVFLLFLHLLFSLTHTCNEKKNIRSLIPLNVIQQLFPNPILYLQVAGYSHLHHLHTKSFSFTKRQRLQHRLLRDLSHHHEKRRPSATQRDQHREND